MVSIPKSSITAAPNIASSIARPNDQFNQIIPKAIQGLGGNLENIAYQQEQNRIREEQAKMREEETFNAAQVLDFRNNLDRFENQQKLQLAELSANDPIAISKANTEIIKRRDEFLGEYTKKYEQNPAILSEIKKQSDASFVDFEFSNNKTLLSKRKEYGINKIYESTYNIADTLEKTGNINKARRDLETTLQLGLKTGLIDQQDVNRERDRQKSIVEQLQKKYEQARIVNAVASGGILLDPTDSQDRKLGDAAFAKAMNNASARGLNLEEAAQSFALKTNYIPSRMKQVWTAKLIGGSAEERVTTAGKIAELINANPRFQDQFGSTELGFINAVKSRIDTGLTPNQIIDNANTEINKIQSLDVKGKLQILNNKDYKKTIDSEYKSLVSDLSNEKGFDFWKSKPSVQAGMSTAFNSLVQDHFLNNKFATEDGAIEYAKDQIKKQYTITNVGRRQVMRFAPESFFNGDTSWIKGQFASEMTKRNLVSNLKDIENKYELLPIPDSIVQGVPSYYVRSNDNDLVRDAKNQLVIFTPKFQDTKEYKDSVKDNERRLGKSLTRQQILSIMEDRNDPNTMSKAIVTGNQLRFK